MSISPALSQGSPGRRFEDVAPSPSPWATCRWRGGGHLPEGTQEVTQEAWRLGDGGHENEGEGWGYSTGA